ncbi:SusC/RagA family TonB-linked outer membrane protein [Lentiprolixibacter aurantiacus]|uniref:SusC/RagA family TonB-linked outer membrane protein n=1 Tax=Lentiprolixibacter aurantiacus TaxID=2993939 RepID=A0AAE3SLY2_9FLAO|nr:SusC/RagA family TonB-linked outer membrane protein [Lentiprolixibacter aurantiacus]MCX2717974.1 SusC/RagA family TonB-linked outer membrane protein [Lentiprolixibacter aurantiacus]
MRSKLTKVLTPLLVFCVSFAFAQKTVTGNVTDSSGIPLPGVAVVVVGTSTGTQTDFDGNYSITVNVGQVLRFSYLGQKTVNRTVSASTSVLNIRMEDDAEQLAEVVVQGYRTAPKTKSAIAQVTISADESIKNRPNASVVQTLSGQVAGLNITTTSGQPGANSLVQLRGVNSINGNTEPLFIIDGAPVDEDNFRSLNPQDIQSISVLKDAGATAIYGNRGANGVIVIKTRTGNYDQGLSINYTGIAGFSKLPGNDYDLMNSQEQLALEKQLNRGRGSQLTDAEIAAAPNFNWVDFFIREGVNQNHTLTLSSGSSNTTQFTSFGFFEQDGVVVESDLKRFNFRNNITGRSEDGRFTYGTNLTINYSISNEVSSVGTGSINRNFLLGANQSVTYITPDEYPGSELLAQNWTFADTPLLLLDFLNSYEQRDEEVRIVASANASYEVAKNLRANVTGSMDYIDTTFNALEAPDNWNDFYFGDDYNGRQFGDNDRVFTYNQVTSLTYDNQWGKHSVNVGAYTEYFKAHFRDLGYRQEGLDPRTFASGDDAGWIQDNSDNDFFVPIINATKRDAGLFSYFGQADYDYDERYGVVGTVRRDASYRFAESNRYATFWSVAGRWNISNESFMDGSVFDVLKLRASIGTAGNQRITGTSIFSAPDLTRSLFATGPGYRGQNALFLSQIPNTTLRWETVKQTNIGLDFEVFNSRLRGSFDVYEKKTTDLFQSTPVSAINSVTTLNANVGSLFNRGVEVDLDYDLIRNKDMVLTLNLVGNYNETELQDLPSDEGEIIGIGRNGGPLDEYFRVRYAGVNPANGNLLFLDADGNLTENPNADTDRVWTSRNPYPDWVGSFGFNFDWKGFYVQTQFNYMLGIDNLDFDYYGRMNPSTIGQFRTSRDLLDAWTPNNRVTSVPSLTASNLNAVGQAGVSSDRFLFSADYVRLRFLAVGYNFPKKFLEGTGIKKLGFFFNGENVLTFTKWRGFDVEGLVSQQNEYPTPRILSLGFEIGI